MQSTLKLNVNGRDVEVVSEPQRVLLDVLREDLHLTGTKYGCGEGSCGACTVLVNGKATFSCSTPVTEVLDAKIETIESLAHGRNTAPGAAGVPGRRRQPVRLLHAGHDHAHGRGAERQAERDRSRPDRRHESKPCRCCNYVNILNAVRRAASNKTAASR
jgi:aerobic-type carbon monoxide dehydrogenase small subunit (CoxS/CutS family)